MLRISKLADYAIVIMNVMANRMGQCLPASQLAEQTGIGEPTVSKLLQALTRENLLQSQLGAQGGYSLILAPQKINLMQIITAIEGEIGLTECDKKNGYCHLQEICTISHNWQQIGNAIRAALAEISLADMQRPANIVKFNLQLN